MLWIAIAVGVAAFVVLSRAARGLRRGQRDAGSAALRCVGASGLFAMAALAVAIGSPAAAVPSIACGVVLTVDLSAGWRRLSARLPRTQSATVTPFQNAT